MVYYIQSVEPTLNPVLRLSFLILMYLSIAFFVCAYIFRLVEGFWVEYIDPKPFFRHFYIYKRTLSKSQKNKLKNKFSFYAKLSNKDKRIFEHRVSKFLKQHYFESRQDEEITETKKILIAATAIMLTFGYRNYTINTVEGFIIYPGAFYSRTNKAYHKGEFNLGLKIIVLSWKDFLEGYDISNDNFNLGIHEFVHAMHLEFIRTRTTNISAAIFINAFNELRAFLDSNIVYKEKLIASRYIRDYGYTNQFEFAAVIVESFIETPKKFKQQFPEMYGYVKQMLNFNFSNY